MWQLQRVHGLSAFRGTAALRSYWEKKGCELSRQKVCLEFWVWDVLLHASNKGKLTVEQIAGTNSGSVHLKIDWRYLVSAQLSRNLKRSSPKMLALHTLSMSL